MTARAWPGFPPALPSPGSVPPGGGAPSGGGAIGTTTIHPLEANQTIDGWTPLVIFTPPAGRYLVTAQAMFINGDSAHWRPAIVYIQAPNAGPFDAHVSVPQQIAGSDGRASLCLAPFVADCDGTQPISFYALGDIPLLAVVQPEETTGHQGTFVGVTPVG